MGDCRTVRMRVAAAKVGEEVVNKDTDVEKLEEDEDEDEDEDEEVKARVLEEIKEPKEAISCSGEGASKVSLVGFEQSSPPEPTQHAHRFVVLLYTMSCVG